MYDFPTWYQGWLFGRCFFCVSKTEEYFGLLIGWHISIVGTNHIDTGYWETRMTPAAETAVTSVQCFPCHNLFGGEKHSLCAYHCCKNKKNEP